MADRSETKRRTSAEVKRDGALAVTFVNTAAGSRRPIVDYAGLLAWSRRHGALSSAEADRLEGLAAERPEEAASAFGAAEELRALLARIMSAAADRESPPREALDALSGYLLHTVPPKRLVPAEGGIELDWAAGREEDLGRPLWPVVLSALEVLTSKDYGRLTRCAAEECGLLFVANNAGSPRKWCDMRACGSRVKSSRRYHGTVKEYRQEVRREAEEAVLKRAAARAERLMRSQDGLTPPGKDKR